jgi:hypothetical protein
MLKYLQPFVELKPLSGEIITVLILVLRIKTMNDHNHCG